MHFGGQTPSSKKASDANKERKPLQYEPDLKEGDLVMLQARSAQESRIEETDEKGHRITLPEKLRNPFIGPFRILAWKGEDKRKCILDIDKRIAHNVNRLIKHEVWDDVNTDTNKKPKLRIEPEEKKSLATGDMIVYRNKKLKNPFGVGKILACEDKSDIIVQSYGDEDTMINKAFFPMWVHSNVDGHYPKAERNAADKEYTNKHMEFTISAEDILFTGENILNDEFRIRNDIKSRIDEAIGEPLAWHLKS